MTKSIVIPFRVLYQNQEVTTKVNIDQPEVAPPPDWYVTGFLLFGMPYKMSLI